MKKLDMYVVIHLNLSTVPKCPSVGNSTKVATEHLKVTKTMQRLSVNLILSFKMVKCLNVQYVTKFHWACSCPHFHENIKSTSKSEQ